MFIYGLYSTEDGIIRYVGKTKYVLSKRLREHVNGALLRNCKTHKDNWIRKVYETGFEVSIKLIEECDDSIWEEREKYWIHNTPSLTNLTEGGEGGHGNLYSVSYDEMKAYIQLYPIKINSKSSFVRESKNFDSRYPKNPKEVFKLRGEWVSWGDFLGTRRVQDNIIAHSNYLSFKEAKKYINIHIKAKTSVEYKKYIDENNIKFLPKKPFRFYRNRGWKGWEDYLGITKPYEISDELIRRYLSIYHPNVTGNWTFRKHKSEIHRAIHLGKIRNFDFRMLISAKKEE